MDGPKPSFIPASEIYAGIGTATPPWLSMRCAAALNASHGMIIAAVRWPPYYIAL